MPEPRVKLLAVAFAGLMITQVLVLVPGTALGVTKSGGNTSVNNLAGNAPTADLPDATINDSTSSNIEVAYNATGKVSKGDLRVEFDKPNGSTIDFVDPSDVNGTDTLTIPANTFGGGDIRVHVNLMNKSDTAAFFDYQTDKAVITTESPVVLENYTLSTNSVDVGENLTATVTLNNTDQNSSQDYSLVLWDGANPKAVQNKAFNKSKRVTVPAGAIKEVTFNISWSATDSNGFSNIGIRWVTINEEPSKSLTITNTSTGFINGSVRNQNGSPVSDVTVDVFDKQTGKIHANLTTDQNGNFSVEVNTGTYQMQIQDPAVSFAFRNSVKVTANNTTRVNFQVDEKPPTGTLKGTVTGPDGNPIENARIRAADQSYRFFGSNKTDSNGNFSLSLPAAKYQLRVENTSYAVKTRDGVNVTANQTTVVDFSLPNATYINGTITKADGTVPKFAYVMASSGENRAFDAVTKKGGGKYNLSVPNGTYTVTVFSNVGTASAEIATDPDNVTTKDFTLRPVEFKHQSVEVVKGASTVDTQNISLRTRVFSGLMNVLVVNNKTYPDETGPPSELEGLGVNDTTEFRINLTVTNFSATSLMWAINDARWNATSNSSVKNGTDITINGSAVQLQATDNGSASIGPLFDQSPSAINWPTGKKDRASFGVNQTIYIGVLDESSLPPEVRNNLKGMSITTNAQMFDAPRVVNNSLKIWIAGPSTTKDGRQHTGFYQAEIPQKQLDSWNVTNPEKQLAALYKGSAANFSVTNTSDGARIRLENITYSAGTVEVSPDTIPPTADAGSDMTVKEGNSVTFDASLSTDNNDIEFYTWDFDGDGVFEKTNLGSATTSYTYDKAGTYNATLKVTDFNGNTDNDTIKVEVQSSGGGGGSTPTPTPTPSPTPTATPTATQSGTTSPTATPTPTPVPTATPTPSPTLTPSPTITGTPSPTLTPTPSPSPTASPRPTATEPETAESEEQQDEAEQQAEGESPTSEDVTTETSGQPGFGIAVALVAILIAGLLAWRRDHGTE